MIEISNLTKAYRGVTVVDDVSLRITAGESVALWGHNGAGKTTIVRCLFGLVRYQGTITVGGFDATTQGKSARKLMGHVPQELSFYDDMTTEETLALSARLRDVNSGRVGEVMELVSLADQGAKRVGSLSGGMKQRLAIGLAILSDPPVLVLDEPTSNLDAASRESVVDLLDSLRGPGRVLLLTSHHLDEVGMLSDRVITLENGKSVLDCAPGELADRLGLRSWLHVVVHAAVGDTVTFLKGLGFEAWPNSRGVLVDVASSQKAEVLAALAGAGIEIRDFEVWR